jgi:hypothetical protein
MVKSEISLKEFLILAILHFGIFMFSQTTPVKGGTTPEIWIIGYIVFLIKFINLKTDPKKCLDDSASLARFTLFAALVIAALDVIVSDNSFIASWIRAALGLTLNIGTGAAMALFLSGIVGVYRHKPKQKHLQSDNMQ